jgi:hypothetical protein
MPCQLPNAPLQIFSNGSPHPGDGGGSLDGLFTSTSQPWREVLPVILQPFDLKTRLLLTPSSLHI